ncbi:MAG: hypothetical protein J5I90_04325 [Caldilineales bacterium]|nr:hypothetical protein [Caldilineales bacterium]
MRSIGSLRGQGPVTRKSNPQKNPGRIGRVFFMVSRHSRTAALLFGLAFLTLFAVQVSASSRPDREAAVSAALAWLHSQQSNDGKVGGFGNSCETAWVVAVTGENPDGASWTKGGISLLDACEAETPTFLANKDGGRIAKVLRAVVAADANPRQFGGLDLIALLESEYDPATGLYQEFSLFRHGLAILALHEAGQSIPAKAVETILVQQRPDGSWGWPLDPTPGDGSPATGDTDTTGLMLQALRAAGEPPYTASQNRAVQLLEEQQNADGGWGSDADDASNSDSTALIIQGLLAAGVNPESSRFAPGGETPVQTLLAFQAANGSFYWTHDSPGAIMRSTLDSILPLVEIYPDDIETPLRFYLPLVISN